jgi:signal peptidase
MARRDRTSADDDDADLDEEDEEPVRSHRPRPSRTGSHRRPTAAVRRWSSVDYDEEDEDDEPRPGPKKQRPGVFWRARDSLYFAPLVGLMIVVLLVVSLYAYTQNWPPVYVVESESMQHGSSDVLGVINTGDLVLAQKVDNASIQTYIVGSQTGYSTYGEYGDVLLYYPNGVVGTPIIHRALIYLDWVPAVQGYTAVGLAGLPCGFAPGAVYATPGTTSPAPDCGWTNLTSTLDLFHVGWSGVNVSIALQPGLLGRHSGFVTMGDNNLLGGQGEYDQAAAFQLSELVEPSWVVGVARGMIPWVGALKLWIEGSSTTSEVPPQSWQFLGLTFAGIILLAFGVHYALRVEGVEDPRRKAAEEAAEEEGERPPEGNAVRARRFLRSLRPWGASGTVEEDEEDEEPPRPTGRRPPKAAPVAHVRARRGRPKPKVRRPEKRRRPPVDDDDL